MNVIELVSNALPASRKQSSSGWINVNAPCCIHNGQPRPDTKKRGGFHIDAESVTYHCFNCGYKTGWKPGLFLGVKFKNLLSWMGISEEDINQCSLYVLSKRSGDGIETPSEKVVKSYSLPEGSKTLKEWVIIGNDDPAFHQVVSYVYGRNGFLLEEYDFYWSPTMKNRVIIPIVYDGNFYGFTARLCTNELQLRYYAEYQSGVLFNADLLDLDHRNFVVVVEGTFDAMAISGVATFKYQIDDKQIAWLKSSGKRVILLPDRPSRDNDPAFETYMKTAIENDFYVSLPRWKGKDADEVVSKYGRLFAMTQIFSHLHRGEFGIRMAARQYMKDLLM